MAKTPQEVDHGGSLTQIELHDKIATVEESAKPLADFPRTQIELHVERALEATSKEIARSKTCGQNNEGSGSRFQRICNPAQLPYR